MSMPYSTILFDADDTLLDFHQAERLSVRQVLGEFALPVTGEMVHRYSLINAALWRAFERGEVTKEELKAARYRRLFEEFGVEQPPDTRAVNDRYLECLSQHGELNDGAMQLCRALKEQGCALYIITNGIANTQRSRLQRSGLLPLLDGIFVSEAIGVQKPFPAFFDYVLAHITERDRRRVLVVGDSLGSDIKGAANAGLDCVWLNPHGKRNAHGYPVKKEIETLAALGAWLGV